MLIQLSGFKYVDRPRKRGKALRFAFSLQVPLVDGQKAELTIEGCLAYYDYKKVLRWSPPITKWGFKTMNFHWINRPLYQLVLDILISHKKSKELLDALFTPMQRIAELADSKNVQHTVPEFPTLLEGEADEDEGLQSFVGEYREKIEDE